MHGEGKIEEERAARAFVGWHRKPPYDSRQREIGTQACWITVNYSEREGGMDMMLQV